MAYIRAHETKQRARGKVVKRYEVVYRARSSTDDGRVVSRLRQESQTDARSCRGARCRAERTPAQPHHRSRRAAQARPTKLRRKVDRLACVAACQGRHWLSQNAHTRRVRQFAGALRAAGAGLRADRGGYTCSARGADRLGLATDGSAGDGVPAPEDGRTCWALSGQLFRYALLHDAKRNSFDRVDFSANRSNRRPRRIRTASANSLRRLPRVRRASRRATGPRRQASSGALRCMR